MSILEHVEKHLRGEAVNESLNKHASAKKSLDIIKELADNDWSGSKKQMREACKRLSELAESDKKAAKKFMKEMDKASSDYGKKILEQKWEDEVEDVSDDEDIKQENIDDVSDVKNVKPEKKEKGKKFNLGKKPVNGSEQSKDGKDGKDIKPEKVGKGIKVEKDDLSEEDETGVNSRNPNDVYVNHGIASGIIKYIKKG